jgi:hypothetical protein
MQGSRSVSDAQQQQQLLAEGREAAEFIRSSIVQAATNERGVLGTHSCWCCVTLLCLRAGGLSVCARLLSRCSMGSGIRDWQCLCLPVAEMKIEEAQVGGLVEEVTPDMKLPRVRQKPAGRPAQPS